MAAGQPTLQFLPARRLFPVVRAISPLSRRDYLIIFNCQSCRARGRLAPGANDRRYYLRATCAPRAVSPSLSRQFRKVCQRANRCDSASFSRYLRIHVVLATEITEIKGRRIAPWLTKAASIRSAANIGLLLSTLGWKIEKKKRQKGKKRLCFTLLR